MIRRGDKHTAGHGLPWPNPAQSMLLQVAIGPVAGVIAALRAWEHMVDLEAEVDGGTYRLLALAYTRALAAGVETPLLGLLKGVYRRHWYETNTLMHDTRPALVALHEAGIPTLAMKGLPLAFAHYRNPAVRPMSDIDLVVSPQDATHALRVLRACGWIPQGKPQIDKPSSHPAIALQSPKGILDIDLHWHCLHETPYTAADHWFWKGASPLDLGGVCVLQPRATALLLHTLLHGIRSNPEPPIRWIADAGTILQTAGDAIDWDDLTRFAREHRTARRVYLGLDLLARDFGLAIPASALLALRKSGTSAIEYVENLNYLGGAHETRRHPRMLGLVSYLRVHRAAGPWRWLRLLPSYLAFRWNLPSTRMLPVEATRRLGRRLRPSWASPA